jgi:hypothetical protein
MWTIETPDDRVDPKLLGDLRGKGRRWHAGAWCAGVMIAEWFVFSWHVGFGGAFPPVHPSAFLWILGAIWGTEVTSDLGAATRRVPSVRRQVLYMVALCFVLALVQLHPELPKPVAVAFYVFMVALAIVSVADLVVSKS